MTSHPADPDDVEAASPLQRVYRRALAQLRIGLLDRVPREQRDTDEAFKRRRVVSLITLIVGAVVLAATLRMEQDSPWFTAATLGVASIWVVGSLLSGRLHAGRIAVSGQTKRPIGPPLLLGGILATIFVVGAFITREIPLLAEQATNVLSFAENNALWLIAMTTIINGIAEEFFFRGALYAAIKEPHQVVVTTLAYAAATLLTGNVMLAFAAAALGYITALQRRSTGGIVAPIITHLTWSLTMLFVLPQIF